MWATSIGLTLAHSPVPGERKSGIHDGTEMPAPVRATTEPASPISWASRPAGVSVLTTTPESRLHPMAETLAENIEPYPGISSKAYEHPADRAATAALKTVPMLDTVVRKLIEWQYERAIRQMLLSNSVRVGERQLPDLWAHHIGVCNILDMPETYDLYVTDTVVANAMAIGSQNPIVVVGSPLLGRLGPGEQRALLAHEVAHILSDHVLYNTALQILLRAGGNIPFPLAIPAAAVRAVLLE